MPEQEYTPTTEEVRDRWGRDVISEDLRPEWLAEFDRWLRQDREAQARFWMRVTREHCWLWTGETAGNGYGRVKIGGQNLAAHRLAYEWLVGPIPDGLEIDHLCSVRNCVNPTHLEAVTHKENTMRGNTITAAAAAKTHCLRGHELAGSNLVPSALRRGRRDCLICSRNRAAARRAKRRGEDR